MEVNETASGASLPTTEENQLLELDDEQLSILLEETIQANAVLEAETEMFEKHFLRLESRTVPKDQAVSSLVPPRDVAFRKRSKTSATDRLPKLTTEQKCDIAQKEIEATKGASKLLEDESEKILDIYKAITEEADIRLTELRKESYEFERVVIKGAMNQRTRKIVAEKCLRYFDERVQFRDALVEKLRLKNISIKLQMRKLKLQLKQKEEMGEILNEVDFNQLKIENQQYLEKIDERNQDLLRLKLMTGNTLQVLNSYKKRLHNETKECEKLKQEVAIREDIQVKIQAETKLVEMDRAQAERMNKMLRKNLTDFKVPDVMEYVMGKAEIYDLQKKIKTWERKVDIAELALKTHSKAWRVMQRRLQGHEKWKNSVDY